MITQKSTLICAPRTFSFSWIYHICILLIAEQVTRVGIIKVSGRHPLPRTHLLGGQRKQPPQNLFWSNMCRQRIWTRKTDGSTGISCTLKAPRWAQKKLLCFDCHTTQSLEKNSNVLVLQTAIRKTSTYPGHPPPKRGQWRANTEISLQQPSQPST